MRLDAERVAALLLLAFCVAYGLMAWQIDLYPGTERQVFNARTLPLALSALGSLVAFLLVVLPSGRRRLGFGRREGVRGAVLLLLALAYAASLRSLGFLLSGTIFLALAFAWLGERSWKRLLLLPVILTAGLELLLAGLLDVYLVDPFLEALGIIR